jgi:hypothetical protein
MPDQTQGTGAPNAPQGSDDPKYVTEEQLNRAISARLSDFGKKTEKSLTDAFSNFEKKLTDMITPKPGEQQTPAADKGSALNVQDHPEFKGLQKQLAELKLRTDVAEQSAKAEREKARDTTLRQKLGESLASIGIKDATRAKHAIRFLVDGERAVRWDENGESIIFNDGKDLVDLETGLKGWAKTEDAKLYLPAPDGGATGGNNGTRPAPTRAPIGSNGMSLDQMSDDQKLAAANAELAKLGVVL